MGVSSQLAAELQTMTHHWHSISQDIDGAVQLASDAQLRPLFDAVDYLMASLAVTHLQIDGYLAGECTVSRETGRLILFREVRTFVQATVKPCLQRLYEGHMDEDCARQNMRAIFLGILPKKRRGRGGSRGGREGEAVSRAEGHGAAGSARRRGARDGGVGACGDVAGDEGGILPPPAQVHQRRGDAERGAAGVCGARAQQLALGASAG